MSVHPTKEWLLANGTNVVHGRVGGKAGLLARISRGLSAYRRRLRERRELAGMSGAELRDIGITRVDVDRVFGPAFVREYASRGDRRLWSVPRG